MGVQEGKFFYKIGLPIAILCGIVSKAKGEDMDKQIAEYFEKDAMTKKLKDEVDAERYKVLADLMREVLEKQDAMLESAYREDEVSSMECILMDTRDYIQHLEQQVSKLKKKNKKLKKQIKVLTEDEV